MRPSNKPKPDLHLQILDPFMPVVQENSSGRVQLSCSLYHPLDDQSLSFFENFLKQRCLVSTTITDTQDIDNEYTVYIIEVRTVYLNYQIKRRFKQFKEFRRLIRKKYLVDEVDYAQCPRLQDVFFNRLNPEIKSRRKRELQGFINFFTSAFSRGQRVFGYLQFLEVLAQLKENKIEGILQSPVLSRKISSAVAPVVESKEQLQQQQQILHEKRIYELLQMTQDDLEIRRHNIRLIGETIAESPPITNMDFISLIIRGQGQPKEDNYFRGFVQLCGKIDKIQEIGSNKIIHDHTSCQYNMEVFNSILECEKNQSYDLFLKEFQEMPMSLLTSLSLDSHILSEKPCKQPALKLLSKFIEGQHRLYSSTDWRFIKQKLKILRYKEAVFREIEAHQQGTQLRKTNSSVQLSLPQRQSSCKMSQSGLLSLSYFDFSDMEESGQRGARQMKEIIDDYFAGWNEVYHYPDKQIRLEHTIPQSKHVRLSVVLPLSVKESLNLLIKQRKVWDSLLLQSTSLDKSSAESQKTSSKHMERVLETYNRGFSKRIQFYCEERIEVEDEGRCIYISRTPYKPSPEPMQTDQTQIGEWENLIMIKDFTKEANRPIQKWLFPSIELDTSQILQDKQVTMKDTSSTDPFSVFSAPKSASPDQLPPSFFNFNLNTPNSSYPNAASASSVDKLNNNTNTDAVEEQPQLFATTPKSVGQRHQSKDLLTDDKNWLTNKLNHHEISERESESYLSSSSAADKSDLSSQKFTSSAVFSEVSSRQFSAESSSQFQRSDQQNGIISYNKSNMFEAEQKQDGIFQLAPPSIRSLPKKAKVGQFIFNGRKKASEDIGPSSSTGENCAIEEMTTSLAMEELRMRQSSTYTMDGAEQPQNQSCQVTFLFHLLNQEAVFFFSKFIVKREDDTLVKNAIKLLDLAKKVRKESASTTDSNKNLRKESNESFPSNASENYILYEPLVLTKAHTYDYSNY